MLLSRPKIQAALPLILGKDEQNIWISQLKLPTSLIKQKEPPIFGSHHTPPLIKTKLSHESNLLLLLGQDTVQVYQTSYGEIFERQLSAQCIAGRLVQLSRRILSSSS